MAFPAMQTPQRPLPGAFFQTPAAPSTQAGYPSLRQPDFRQNPPVRHQATSQMQKQDAVQQSQQQQLQPGQAPQAQVLQPIERAARTINEALQKEASFPDLDSYVKREYDSRGMQSILLTLV